MKSAAKACAERLGQSCAWECSLTICGKSRIRTLNRTYRKKDRATDVLAFPLHENLRFEKAPLSEAPINLGDIYICRDIAAGQAQDFKISYEWEVVRLFVHGWLHLLGYDHELSAKEEALMASEEKKLLEEICKN